MPAPIDEHEMMMAILRTCAVANGPTDFGDVLGEEGDTSGLERELGRGEPVDLGDRILLLRCLRDLIRRGLLVSAAEKHADRSRSVVITDMGGAALQEVGLHLFIDELLETPAAELVAMRPVEAGEVPWLWRPGREDFQPELARRIDTGTSAVHARLVSAAQPGDEIWVCRSRIYDPWGMNGHEGLGIVRGGDIVGYLRLIDY